MMCGANRFSRPDKRISNPHSGRSSTGFTLIELLVVISVIALLLAILLPALQRVKKQANAVVCQSNLCQWGLCFKMYTDDNNGRFSNDVQYKYSWYTMLSPYYSDSNDLLLCPMATKYSGNPYWIGSKFSTWGWPACESDAHDAVISLISTGSITSLTSSDFYGSYAVNGWIFDLNWEPAAEFLEYPYWEGVFVKGTNNNTGMPGLRLDGTTTETHRRSSSV
jgi:prepilin-type N-terminal cleavage/methylation domain-containing protein